jgi:hypothetical protein
MEGRHKIATYTIPKKTALELIYLNLKWLEGNFLWGYPRSL